MTGDRCKTDTYKDKEVFVIPGRECHFCGKSGYTPLQSPLMIEEEGRENQEEETQKQEDSEKVVEAAN